MSGEKNLTILIKEMQPFLNKGTYVFTSVKDASNINSNDILFQFKETEGTTLVLTKEKAAIFNLKYSFVASWITLKIHSSLDAVGLTAIFSTELAKHNISCNVVAGYYHDHIFVNIKDTQKTLDVLKNLSENYK